MKLPILAAMLCLFSVQSQAQTTASWNWGKADIADISTGNLSATQHVAAAGGNKVLWGMLQDQALNYSSFYFGSYKLTEYNNIGTPGGSALIKGKLYIAAISSDAAGNWYILGQYYDSVSFPGGPSFVNPAPLSTSPGFIAKFNGGSLTCAWATIIGGTNVFTVNNNGVYAAIDSDLVTYISKFDLATGSRTDVITQPFRSYSSSIAVDGAGNIYLAGGCAFSGINFNGHIVSTTGIAYPVYLVKYKADGTYGWHHLLSDVTCPNRQITLANDNIIYYSGKIFDSFTFGSFPVHHPRWVYDYLVSRLDSSGNIIWVTQQKDTLEGDANAGDYYHAVAMADASLSVFAEIRGYIDWGNGIVTDDGITTNSAVVNYSLTGGVNWVKPVAANTVSSKNIAGNGTDIWLTGNAYDSAAYHLDAISVPVVPVTSTPYMAMLHTAPMPAGVPGHVDLTNEFEVMPVPATDVLNISLPYALPGDIRIRLLDISGRLLIDKTLNGRRSDQLDVKQYSRGLYFIECSGNNFRMVKKVVLQ